MRRVYRNRQHEYMRYSLPVPRLEKAVTDDLAGLLGDKIIEITVSKGGATS